MYNPALMSGGSKRPLDGLPAPTIARGVRRLLSSYTGGKLVRVRRASDNVELDIGSLPNGNLDVPALTAFLASTTGFYVTRYDQSGNGYDDTQATAANQPAVIISSSNFNGRPSVGLTGASSQVLIKATPPTIAQPFTISAVAIRTGAFTGASGVIVGSHGSNGALYFEDETIEANVVKLFFGTGLAAGVAAAHSIPHAVIGRANGASSSIIVDQTISAIATPGAGSLIGTELGATQAASFITGEITEDIVFSSPLLSNNDALALQVNQKAYYGTA